MAFVPRRRVVKKPPPPVVRNTFRDCLAPDLIFYLILPLLDTTSRAMWRQTERYMAEILPRPQMTLLRWEEAGLYANNGFLQHCRRTTVDIEDLSEASGHLFEFNQRTSEFLHRELTQEYAKFLLNKPGFDDIIETERPLVHASLTYKNPVDLHALCLLDQAIYDGHDAAFHKRWDNSFHGYLWNHTSMPDTVKWQFLRHFVFVAVSGGSVKILDQLAREGRNYIFYRPRFWEEQVHYSGFSGWRGIMEKHIDYYRDFTWRKTNNVNDNPRLLLYCFLPQIAQHAVLFQRWTLLEEFFHISQIQVCEFFMYDLPARHIADSSYYARARFSPSHAPIRLLFLMRHHDWATVDLYFTLHDFGRFNKGAQQHMAVAALYHGYMPIVHHWMEMYKLEHLHGAMECGTSAEGLQALQGRRPDLFKQGRLQGKKENIARRRTLSCARWPVIEWCFEHGYLPDDWAAYHEAVDRAYQKRRRDTLAGLYRRIRYKKGTPHKDKWPEWAMKKLEEKTKEFLLF